MCQRGVASERGSTTDRRSAVTTATDVASKPQSPVSSSSYGQTQLSPFPLPPTEDSRTGVLPEIFRSQEWIGGGKIGDRPYRDEVSSSISFFSTFLGALRADHLANEGVSAFSDPSVLIAIFSALRACRCSVRTIVSDLAAVSVETVRARICSVSLLRADGAFRTRNGFRAATMKRGGMSGGPSLTRRGKGVTASAKMSHRLHDFI